MIRINLLPKEERISARRFSMPKVSAMVPVGILAGVIILVGITATVEHAKVGALRSDVADLREEVRAIQPQVDRVKRLTAQREELERRLDVIRRLDEGRFLTVRVMDSMSREVPRYLWMTGMQQQGAGRVTFSGVTFSNLIVADYMKRLDRSPMFTGVDLTTTQRGEIDGRDVMEFTVTAELTPYETPSDFTAATPWDAPAEEER